MWSSTCDTTLVLVGSPAALPGRHGWRKPLYSIAKGLIPTLAQVVTLELGAAGQRCTALIFDALDGDEQRHERHGTAARVAHADRSPFGLVPTMRL